MKRKVTRAPFVVTVALASAVGACGGSTFTGSNDGGGGSAASGGSSGSGTGGSGGTSGFGGTSGSGAGGSGGTNGKCPASAPDPGTACAISGLVCDYARCVTQGLPDISVVCQSGAWQSSGGASCNPPPPMCPTAEPPSGTPCSLPDGTMCPYPTDPNGCCPPPEATCTGGVWQVSISTCNPPAPMCPVDPPIDGSSCATGNPCVQPPSICTYGDCLDGGTGVTATCDGNVWTSIGCATAGG